MPNLSKPKHLQIGIANNPETIRTSLLRKPGIPHNQGIFIGSFAPIYLPAKREKRNHHYQNTSQSILGLDLAENLLRSALDDTTSNGQASALLQVQIDLAGRLATLVDTPEVMLVVGLVMETR